MKFIFPKNYTFKNKLLGFIDYSTAILNVIWFGFVFSLSNMLFENIDIKIFLCIFLTLPVFLFSIIGFEHENIIYVFLYITKFIQNRKIYFYRKYTP